MYGGYKTIVEGLITSCVPYTCEIVHSMAESSVEDSVKVLKRLLVYGRSLDMEVDTMTNILWNIGREASSGGIELCYCCRNGIETSRSA